MKKHGTARIARAALSAGLALSMAMGGIAPALAETSSGQTNLYVQVQESSLTTPEGYGEQMRVTIPVAINYVADETGALTGPADGATLITNNTKTGAVHVAQIGVQAASGVTIVPTAEAADADDEVYLSVTPGTGAADAAQLSAEVVQRQRLALGDVPLSGCGRGRRHVVAEGVCGAGSGRDGEVGLEIGRAHV